MNINITHQKNNTTQLSYHIFYAALAFNKILQGHSLEYIDNWLPKNMLTYRASIISYTKQAIRDYGTTSYIVKQYTQHKKLHAQVKSLLHISLSLILQNNIAQYTIINQSVDACKMHKHSFYASGLVNGLLRNIINAEIFNELINLHLTYLPKWWLDKIQQENNIDVDSYLQLIQQQPSMGLRVNPLKINRQEYLNLLQQNNIEAYMHEDISTPYAIILPNPISVEKLPNFHMGFVSVQDASAQISPQLLPLKNGMKILDACSAPGGKILSCLEQYKLDVTVMDINSSRVEKIWQNIERLELQKQLIRYKQYIGDAMNLKWWDKEEFDIVIADVPCSASGIVRKQPEIAIRSTENNVNNLQHIQAQILDNLWHTVKKSGILLYITCSIFKIEGLEQINLFLHNHKDAQPLKTEITGQVMVSSHHDGFFYFLLQKIN